MMGYISFSSKSLIIINFFILLASFLHALGDSAVKPKRETLEIIIGGGGIGIGGGGNCNTQDCPPPPSPPPNTECPQPPKPHIGPEPLFFADERLAVVYPVIQKFKNFITSDPLGITKTWEGSDICNKYKGFFCGNPPDNKTATGLASIDFNGYRLGAPSLEGFLDQLPDLALFHANSNNFSGTISSKITKLRYLYELDISNNKFSGQFPTAVLGMKGLTFLDIRFNFFGGYLPAQLFTQPIIDVIFVNNNNFKQKLPDNLGNTTAHYLTFANNKFVGSIPRSIRKASATLIEVLFLNNQLSGCLPYEIGFLKETTVFDAGQNCLTGPIPCSFGCLEKMELLNFAGNQLYGQIPEVVCALGNLANLSLSDNYFTEVGPMCRKLIKRGVLDVRKNCIHDGASQRSEAECAAFFSYPRSCPYEASYSLIPCKLPHFSQKTSPRSSRPSPSYSALTRHRS